MKLSFDEARKLYSQYAEAERSMSAYYVELPEDVNTVDPLFLLERINEAPSFVRKVELVTALISGKKVEVWYQPAPLVEKDEEAGTEKVVETYDPEKIMGFTFNGTGSLGALFTEEPYLLQVVIDYGYAIILKKLTPPSRGSKEATAR